MPDRVGAMGKEASAFVAESHEAQDQRICWVRIRLREPHARPRCWLMLHSHLGGQQCAMKGG